MLEYVHWEATVVDGVDADVSLFDPPLIPDELHDLMQQKNAHITTTPARAPKTAIKIISVSLRPLAGGADGTGGGGVDGGGGGVDGGGGGVNGGGGGVNGGVDGSGVITVVNGAEVVVTGTPRAAEAAAGVPMVDEIWLLIADAALGEPAGGVITAVATTDPASTWTLTESSGRLSTVASVWR
jgi:hypothetical protein